MKRQFAHHTLVAVVAILGAGWLNFNRCRADQSIASIVADVGGKFTVGSLTFMFDGSSVSSDAFDGPYTPTAANIFVTAVGGGVEFTIQNMVALRGQAAKTSSLTINYSVTAPVGIGGAGLSYTGFAQGDNASSSVTETFPDGHTEMMSVFSRGIDDTEANNQKQNNQSTSFDDQPLTLKVRDVGTLSIPDRGGDARSDTSLTNITNTFTVVPEPSSLLIAAFGTLAALGLSWHARKRR
jgi:hypothetical protein